MSSVLLDYPRGLGDHLRFSAIAREYCKRYDRVGIFCTPDCLESVTFLYRDLSNIKIHLVSSFDERRRFCRMNMFRFGQNHYDKIQLVDNTEESGVMVEQHCYGMAGVPFEKKWESFFVERDPAREQALRSLITPAGPYIFIHDDARYPISTERITSPLPAVRPEPNKTNNIFDYYSLLEGAQEIHVIDSSFMFLADLLPYENSEQRLVVHRYARPNLPEYLPILKKNWEILE